MKLKLFCITLLSVLSVASYAQTESDPDESEIRENPVIDGDENDPDTEIPSFIHRQGNRIDFNGADWTHLRNELAHSSKTNVGIVHIGDSHLQADYATRVVRDNLQLDYGNAGRGLVVPLKLAGTNQPLDFSFMSNQNWNGFKLLSKGWPRTMGFTGVSVTPSSARSSFTVRVSDKEDYNPFSDITVFHKGQFYVTSVSDADGKLIPFIAVPSKDYTHISLTRNVISATINFDSAGDLTLFGANLSGARPGVSYHVIGNNGATYESYNRVGNVGQGIAALNPELVIISLGTNEAFGTVDRGRLTASIDRLVNNIKKSLPDAEILLVTPMECQKAVYKKTKGKERRRSRSRSVRSFVPNDKIALVRDIIMDYGKNNHIALYDWYDIAGGAKASEKWIRSGLFSSDRIHHSVKGYNLQGMLLYQALKNAFNSNSAN